MSNQPAPDGILVEIITPDKLQAATTKVFVYGTLKPGYANFARYCNGRVHGAVPACFHQGKLYEVGMFPAMVKGSERVFGFVLELCSPEILGWLDTLESYHLNNPESSMYLRREVVVYDAQAVPITCWTYYWNCGTSSLRHVTNGNWDPRNLHADFFSGWSDVVPKMAGTIGKPPSTNRSY